MYMSKATFDKRIIFVIFFAIIILYLYNVNKRVISLSKPISSLIAQPFVYENGLELTEGNSISHRPNVMESWCRILSRRWDWQSLIEPCKSRMEWVSKLKEEQAYLQTDTITSFVSAMDIRPAGEVSRIFIKTVTKQGQLKTVGGDTWRVKINGTANISPTIFDNGDGTYEVVFLCKDNGVYYVHIFLDYSTCDGLRDPPHDWFVRGNAQGKYQGIDVIGTPEDFLMSPLQSFPITIDVPAKRLNISDEEMHCKLPCEFLWDGQGRWKDNKWISYFDYKKSQDAPKHRHSTRRRKKLLVYGDSVNVFFAQSLKQRKNLIGKIFESSSFSYNWIYEVKNISMAKKQRDRLDFNVSRIIAELKETIKLENINNKESALILNFGLHFVESTNFSNYQLLVNEIAELLTRKDFDDRPWFAGDVIWKTTTAINKERADKPQLHWRRFLTNHRVQLYNAYAIDVMCKSKIPIIDAYLISESYPFGTGTHTSRSAAKNDVVHYNNEAFYPIEVFLQDYFEAM